MEGETAAPPSVGNITQRPAVHRMTVAADRIGDLGRRAIVHAVTVGVRITGHMAQLGNLGLVLRRQADMQTQGRP